MRDFDWTILVTLYKTGSLSKTANLLFISQPALTKRIQAIEDELGLPLVVRNRSGCTFTANGEQIVKKASDVVRAIHAVRSEAESRRLERKSVLRIGVPYSYVRYVLPSLVAKFIRQFGEAEIAITSAISDELVQLVEDDVLDLCFARYNAENSSLERMFICEDQIHAVCNRPIRIDQLPEMPYIEFNKNPATISAIERWWNEQFDTAPVVRFKVNTGDACLSMIHHGLGYGIFPDPKFFQYETDLYTIPLDYKDGSKFTRKTWLLFKSTACSHPSASRFLSFMQDIDVNQLAD